MSNLVIRSRPYSSDLRKAACSIEDEAWNDLGFLNFTRSHYELYDSLLEDYADYQLCLVDEDRGYPVAVANCVPISCAGAGDLPPEGWDWVVESAAATHSRKRPNMLGALSISVPVQHRSKGYARLMIQALLELAKAKGFDGLVAPVRPSAKAKHPHVSIEDYITWTDARGRAFDPWLRSHLAAGGKLIGPCRRSMVVNEHLGFWENWSKQTFDHSGDYEFDGALVPIHIDVERQCGRYEEPNVWVAYGVS